MTGAAWRKRVGAIWIILWSVWFSPAVFAQSASDLESDLRSILESSRVTGAGIVIVEEGQPSIEVYWGLADRIAEIPVSAETVFRAGSISKSVTSTIAMRLAEDGRIDLDATVRSVAPEIDLHNPWAATDPVRIAHLMEHTAGLAGSSYREYSENMVDAPPEAYLDVVGALNVRWRPGTLYSYSNAGHTVLARVLEIASGQSFDDLAQTYVFDSLDMQSASFLTYGTAPDRVARSYTLDGRPEPVWEMLIRPSGSLMTTPRDLAKFVALHAGDGGGLVSPEQLARMARSETSEAARQGAGAGAYGYGSFSFAAGDQVFRGHWGQTEGFRANMGYLPGKGAGFVFMLNAVDEQAASALRKRIADHFSATLGTPAMPNKAEPDPTVLSAAAGHYVLATHEQPMRDWLFKALDQRRIIATQEGLQVASSGLMGGWSQLYRPAADGGYMADGLPLATAVVADLDGRKYWIDGDGYVRVSGLEAAFRRLILPLALLISIAAILHGAVWGGLSLAGRGPSGDGLWIRAALLASGLGFLVTSALFARFGLLGSWAGLSEVGRPSLVSLCLMLFSVLAVLGAFAAAVLTGQRVFRQPGLFLIWAVPASLILLAFALLWVFSGWFPLISWVW
ncbi:MAG: serine hydrolase domain-containing protein [Pseudomonadota bacterium]